MPRACQVQVKEILESEFGCRVGWARPLRQIGIYYGHLDEQRIRSILFRTKYNTVLIDGQNGADYKDS